MKSCNAARKTRDTHAADPALSPDRLPVNDLWHSGTPGDWLDALDHYWDFVKPDNLELETALNELHLDRVSHMQAQQWYDFLKDEYFRWKYTAPNRYGSTTKALKRYETEDQLGLLNLLRIRLLLVDPDDIKGSLQAACLIRGLGVAGGSGLLSLMYPADFATVDQFVVKALRKVAGLPEAKAVAKMKPESLSINNGVMLIELLRRKATELNQRFGTDFWTPRKLDMILWTYGR